MSFNGSGTFNINSAGQPVVSGTVISSSTFNTLTADLATGLSTCITKDGQTTVTANIPLNSYKITGLAAGTAATDAARVGQLQAGAASVVTAAGTDTYTGTMSPSLGAYAAGNTFTFVVPNTNTTASTLNIDGLGAKALTRDGSTALVAGDLVANAEVVVVYDGTRFQVLNSNSKTNFNLSGTLTVAGNTTLSGGTANGVAYLNASKVVTAGSALTFDGTNLGVGGTASQRLHVQNAGALIGLLQNTASTADARYRIQNTAGSSDWGVDGTGTYFQDNNSRPFLWFTGGSEQMRLTSTGLGIGTSSPATKLDVVGTVKVTSSSALSQYWNSASGAYTSWQYNGTTNGDIGTGNQVFSGGATGDFGLTSRAGNLVFGTGSTERARIDTSGNFGLGMTPVNILDITKTQNAGSSVKILNSNASTAAYSGFIASNGTANTYLLQFGTGYTTSNAAIQNSTLLQADTNLALHASTGTLLFYTGSIERARIDTSGNLLLGTTSVSSLSGNCFAVGVSNYAVCHGTGTSSGTNYAGFLYNGSTIGSITQSGTAAVLYNVTSDRRLKDNITDADSASDLIDAIKVRQFDWKSDGNHQRYGMIAQELHEVAPEAVHSPADPDDMMAVDYSKLVPMLVKEIQSLRVRLNALENK